jgi:hypothetical protein
MTKEQAIALLADVIQVGKYLHWDSSPGKDLAWRIMDDVHRGKYGDSSGFWVQADEAVKVLRGTRET